MSISDRSLRSAPRLLGTEGSDTSFSCPYACRARSILSLKMILEWLAKRDPKWAEAAQNVGNAVVQAPRDGIRTPELGGSKKTREVEKQ